MPSPKNTTPLALPAPDESPTSDPGVTTLEVGGKSVSFDKLGPMVVNSDGTLSRIANWQEMTPAEQNNTIRVLSKRNQLRTSIFAQAQATSSTPGGDTITAPHAD
ncbi:putative fungal specific transcription protein [Rhizoctonia solani 123E]|uniref:Putative fungal specific transcription protein n=1 Tax=Rhizoctonia solani 123E TaxID=1423351 RepID=A0A074S7D4_9AGAM|nr:putative fungal specific transcription protein [Rhizoctonia solani 123E]